MMKGKKRHVSSSFVWAAVVIYEHLPKSHSGVSGDSKRRRRYASQGHRAKSLSNVGGKEFPEKDTNTLFCVCTFIIVIPSPPPPQPTPLSPAGSQQSTCVVHSTRCCRLRVVAFLGLTLPPSPANSGSVPLHFFVHLTPQILKSQTCAFGVINQAWPLQSIAKESGFPELPTQTERAPPIPCLQIFFVFFLSKRVNIRMSFKECLGSEYCFMRQVQFSVLSGARFASLGKNATPVLCARIRDLWLVSTPALHKPIAHGLCLVNNCVEVWSFMQELNGMDGHNTHR